MRILILCLLFLIPTALAADKGIFYILDEKFINDISELPYSLGSPSISWQQKGNIKAWIDIVGWRNLSRDEDKYYILGDPASLAIVQYSAEGRPPGYVDSIEKILSFSQSGNNLTAHLNVVLKWHTVSCDKDSCWNNYFNEKAAFQDIEAIPEKFEKASELRVNLMQYNNSLYENIGISITNISGLNKYTIQYEDNTATYRLKKAHVEQTTKGIYFANVTPAEFFDLEGKNISRYGKMILLNGNLSKMNLSDIKITGSNLYETRTANSSQFNITKLEFKPEKELENPVSMWFMSVMAVMAGGIYFYARRMTQWLRNM